MSGFVLCPGCSQDIQPMPSICYACGKATNLHRLCVKDYSSKKPSATYMFTEYKDLAKEVMHDYKFNSKRSAAKDIALLLNDYYPFRVEMPIVTYVPTSSKHIRQRGFDHSSLLALEFARLRGWRVVSTLVKRKSTTQVGANRVNRLKQLKGAYSINNTHDINGANIVLIDDVVTTAATIEACTKVLYDAGAKNVEILAFARTP